MPKTLKRSPCVCVTFRQGCLSYEGQQLSRARPEISKTEIFLSEGQSTCPVNDQAVEPHWLFLLHISQAKLPLSHPALNLLCWHLQPLCRCAGLPLERLPWIQLPFSAQECGWTAARSVSNCEVQAWEKDGFKDPIFGVGRKGKELDWCFECAGSLSCLPARAHCLETFLLVAVIHSIFGWWHTGFSSLSPLRVQSKSDLCCCSSALCLCTKN